MPHPYAAALIWITSNRTLEEKFNIYAPPCIILLLSRELMMQTCFKHKKQTWNSHFEAFASLSFQGPSRNDSCDWTNRTLKSNKCWKDFGEETVFFPYENPNNLLACNERWKSIEAFQKSFDWKNYYKLKSVPSGWQLQLLQNWTGTIEQPRSFTKPTTNARYKRNFKSREQPSQWHFFAARNILHNYFFS